MTLASGKGATAFVVILLGCLLAGAPALAFPATSKGLSEAVRAAVAAQYQVPAGDVDVRALMPDLQAVAGQLPEATQVIRAGPIRQLGPAVSVKVDLLAGEDRRNRSVVLRFALEAWRTFPVVNRRMTRGDVLGTAELELRRLPLSRVPADAMQSVGALLGARLLRPVASGSTLVPAFVDLPPVVRQGSTVRVVVRSGGLEVLAQGAALQDGRAGQYIRVLNPTSRRDFLARVRDPEVVEIDMEEVEE